MLHTHSLELTHIVRELRGTLFFLHFALDRHKTLNKKHEGLA